MSQLGERVVGDVTRPVSGTVFDLEPGQFVGGIEGPVPDVALDLTRILYLQHRCQSSSS